MENLNAGARRPRDLVVLLHAWGYTARHMGLIKKLVEAEWARLGREALVEVPEVGVQSFSFKNPLDCARDLVDRIDLLWSKSQPGGFDEIILLGHSIGALIVRKAFVMACGSQEEAPIECAGFESPRPWAGRVARIVLLAGMNRGWSFSHHITPWRALGWLIGIQFSRLCMLVSGGRRMPVVYAIRRGSPFITNLRLQWLAMHKLVGSVVPRNATTVQLLGSVDDMVAPEDNIDLASGGDFFYLDVPKSGHANVIEVDNSEAGQARSKVLTRALTASRDDLARWTVIPTDQGIQKIDERITDVVFVIHGIRDEGYWTHKIARTVEEVERMRNRDKDLLNIQRGESERISKRYIKSETSSYGYFAMLPFLLPGVRRQRMEWLMDRYTENKARYPNASFSFVGHSHGTYMLARALLDYRCVQFKNVVFAGSVVRRDYKWRDVIGSQVGSVLNFVATSDWVVAIFPKALQTIRFQDLGSAGHDGFIQTSDTVGLEEVRFVPGQHGAALKERYWTAIADFVLDGKTPEIQPVRRERYWAIVFAGLLAPLIWLVIALCLAAIGLHILAPSWAGDFHAWLLGISPHAVGEVLSLVVPESGSTTWAASKQSIYFLLYVLVCWRILTRV